MRRALVAALAAAALLLAGCATAGKDAVATGEGDFQFVAPGRQSQIFYDPPESRGKIRGLSGPSLLRAGETVGLDNYPDKVVVVNIWGSWCGPCREEMPDLQFVADQTGAVILGLDVRDNQQAALDFVRNRGVSFDSIFDPPGRALAGMSGYPRNVVPSSIVFDTRHRVAAVYLTRVRVGELIPLVQRLQAEGSSTAP